MGLFLGSLFCSTDLCVCLDYCSFVANFILFKDCFGELAVQWLGLSAFTAEGPGSIPRWGTKIPKAAWSKKKRIVLAILGLLHFVMNIRIRLLSFCKRPAGI